MAYPKYEVTFAGRGVPNRKRTVDGSHTFRWESGPAPFEIRLTTGSEEDPIPKLTIEFIDQEGGTRAAGTRKVAIRRPAKKTRPAVSAKKKTSPRKAARKDTSAAKKRR